jgi:YHS domain-containing protein
MNPLHPPAGPRVPAALRAPAGTASLGLAVLVGAALVFAPESRAQHEVPGEAHAYSRIKYADSLVSLNDRCIVAQSHLNTKVRPVYVNSQPIGFCCVKCPSVFVQDPDRYLLHQEIHLPDLIEPKREAILIPAMRVHVNYEIFYFATSQNRQKFLDDPVRYCGLLTDPVSQKRFKPGKSSPKESWEGRLFIFSSDSTRRVFDAKPETYAVRQGG